MDGVVMKKGGAGKVAGSWRRGVWKEQGRGEVIGLVGAGLGSRSFLI